MLSRDNNPAEDALRHLTPAEFMALGGKAVVFVRQISGDKLAEMMSEADVEGDLSYHLVVSADGSPLMVGDSQEAVAEWLSDKNFGIVTLH